MGTQESVLEQGMAGEPVRWTGFQGTPPLRVSRLEGSAVGLKEMHKGATRKRGVSRHSLQRGEPAHRGGSPSGGSGALAVRPCGFPGRPHLPSTGVMQGEKSHSSLATPTSPLITHHLLYFIVIAILSSITPYSSSRAKIINRY